MKGTKTSKQAGGQEKGTVKKAAPHQQVLTESQKVEIKKAFDYFDITGSGTYFSNLDY